MKEERVKSILEYLSDEYVSSGVLAAKLDVSSRTIRNELKEIEDIIEEHGAIIENKPKQGIRIIINDQDKFNDYLNSLGRISLDDVPDSKEKRVNFLMEYLLDANDYVKIEDLCDRLYISQSTLSQDLKEVREKFNKYNLKLISKPSYGLKVSGREFDLRLCMRNTSLNEDLLPGEGIDKKEVLQRISNVLYVVFEKYNYHMSDVSYKNLIIHIYVALYRSMEKQVVCVPHEQLEDIIKWDEYKIALEIIKDIEKEFDIEVPECEAAYVAIHLAAKKILNIEDSNNDNVVIDDKVYEITTEMLNAVNDAYHIDLRDDLELGMMMSLHLVPFGVRMAYDIVLHNPLLVDIKTNYTIAYSFAVVASDVLKKRYNKEISEDEIAYFALHFNLALERRKQKLEKKNVLVVCGTGRGTSQLLLYQFKEKFGKYINNIKTSDVFGVKSVDFSKIDYVVTTVPINFSVPVPILEIKTFLHDTEVKKIKKFLSQDTKHTMPQYIKKELFLTDVELKNKDEVIRYMVSKINDYYEGLPFEFYDAILQREKQAVTEFGNKVAIPHPNKALTKDTFVCICILNKPIIWDTKKVQLVYMMSMETDPNRNLMTFYKLTSKLLVNETYVNEIIDKKDYNVVIELLNQIEDTLE